MFVRMREQHDWFFGVIDDAVGETGLIVEDECNAIRRRYVCGRDDRELLPRQTIGESDAANPAARCRTANRDAVQHARHRDVVHVLRGAGDFRSAFFAWHSRADEWRTHVQRVYDSRTAAVGATAGGIGVTSAATAASPTTAASARNIHA